MRLIPPGNAPKLTILGGTFTQNVDGSVDTTDPMTISGLMANGWLGSQEDLSGTGSPEGVVAAPVGTEYRQTDGTTQTALWVKGSGTGTTGWIPFGAMQIRTASKTLSADGTAADGAIVGTGAQSLGHSAGVTLVSAVAAKIIVPLSIRIDVTYATAAYTGGGNITAIVGSTSLTTAISAANSFGLAASGVAFANQAAAAANALHNSALFLKAASAFTQPGTAAGTGLVTVAYVLL